MVPCVKCIPPPDCSWLVASDGFGDASLLVRRASLEDVFLILTGRTLED